MFLKVFVNASSIETIAVDILKIVNFAEL